METDFKTVVKMGLGIMFFKFFFTMALLIMMIAALDSRNHCSPTIEIMFYGLFVYLWIDLILIFSTLLIYLKSNSFERLLFISSIHSEAVVHKLLISLSGLIEFFGIVWWILSQFFVFSSKNDCKTVWKLANWDLVIFIVYVYIQIVLEILMWRLYKANEEEITLKIQKGIDGKVVW